MKETLILSVKEIMSLVSMKECIDLQEKAFRALGKEKTINAPNSWLFVDKHHGHNKLMACFMEGEEKDYQAVKTISSYPNNVKHNLPTVLGCLALIDPETSLPICFMDAAYITALRTGAGGALAAKLLARKNSENIGVIGTGNTAGPTLRGILETLEGIKRGKVFSRSPGRRQAFCTKISQEYSVDLKPVESAQKAVDGADIVITGTTSPTPVLLDEWIKPGMHINAMGIRTEIDPKILKRSKIVGDSLTTAVDDGKSLMAIKASIISSKDVYGDLGDLLLGRKPGRAGEGEITFFDSSGVAVQDVVVAGYVYEKALRNGVGVRVDMFSGVEQLISP
ncbi:MAG: hypothetical protein HY619_01355 [Thaumarchaeota archaeon]|nr:hypothetical protein [Nitrososphaerota archaeon]